MQALSCGMRDLVPWPGIEPGPSALGARCLLTAGPRGKSLGFLIWVSYFSPKVCWCFTYCIVLNMVSVSWTISRNEVFIMFVLKLFGLVLKLWKLFWHICQRKKQPGLCCCDRFGTVILHVLVRQQEAVWDILLTAHLKANLCKIELFFSLGLCDHVFILRNWASVCIVLGNRDTLGHLSVYSIIS